MREIKFRVWNENDEKMINWDQLRVEKDESDHKLSIVIFDGCVGDHYDHFPMMQYTGVKDKNGKEIYEGDILKTKQIITKVHWLETGWYETVLRSNFNHLMKIFPITGWEESEVIGNIFQNGDLLNDSELPKTN